MECFEKGLSFFRWEKMDRIRDSLTDNSNREKIFLMLGWLICLIISSVFVFIYKYNNESIKKFQVYSTEDKITDNYFIGCDPISTEGNILTITGWIAPKNTDLTYVNRKILLKDSANIFYAINTVAEDRGLTEFFNTGYDYDLGGIRAQCPISKLKADEEYRVFFFLEEQNGEKYLVDMEMLIKQ